MDEIWDLFKKREALPFVLLVSLVVLVFSIYGCYQNYKTTYEQLSVAFGPDIGLTFTALSQAVEFLVPILLAWGIMRSLKIHAQITAFVVATGIVAWVTDAVTAFMHFYEVGQSAMVLKILWSVVGSFLFVTMEIWVMLSMATVIAAMSVLLKGELPQWVTSPTATVQTPHLQPSTPRRFDFTGLLHRVMQLFRRPACSHQAAPTIRRSIARPGSHFHSSATHVEETL